MKNYLIGGISFFLLVTLCFVVLGVITIPPEPSELSAKNGVLDLSEVDFENEVIAINPDVFIHYPEQLVVPSETGTPGTSETASFGTNRLRLLLPKDTVFTLSQSTNHMAITLIVDGQVLNVWGTVGATAEQSRAEAGTLLASFYTSTGEVDLSYQYSSFIRWYKPQSIEIGTAELIFSQNQQLMLRDMLFTACFFTAGLFALSIFLFFGRKSPYIWFALLCFCLMTEQLVTNTMPLTLLLPLRAEALARIEYLAVLGVLVCLVFYANALFRKTFHRWMGYLVGIVFALYAACILLLPPALFTGMRVLFLACTWVIALYGIVMMMRRVRKPTVEQTLILLGVLLLVAVGLTEQTILRWLLPYRLANGFLTHCATVGAIFLNMAALSLAALKAERELEKAHVRELALGEENRMLDRLSAMKTEFFTNVSHEMKTPLTVMSVNAQVAKAMVEQGVDRERVYESLDVVTAETLRLARMVNDMLELGSFRESQSSMEQIALSPLLIKTGAVCEPLVNKRGNRLVLSVPEALPPLWGNADRLIQVVVNLLSNAAMHTKDGVIELAARVQDGIIAVSITDTGTGIAEDLLPHVFERQVQSREGGSGLGLGICKEIIEQHGGAITLENRQDGGCIACFTLPIDDEEKERGNE